MNIYVTRSMKRPANKILLLFSITLFFCELLCQSCICFQPLMTDEHLRSTNEIVDVRRSLSHIFNYTYLDELDEHQRTPSLSD